MTVQKKYAKDLLYQAKISLKLHFQEKPRTTLAKILFLFHPLVQKKFRTPLRNSEVPLECVFS